MSHPSGNPIAAIAAALAGAILAQAGLPIRAEQVVFPPSQLQTYLAAIEVDNGLVVLPHVGAIYRADGGVLQSSPLIRLLEIDTTPEMGLLGLAVPPDFMKSRDIYLFYTARYESQLLSVVSRLHYPLGATTIDRASEQVLLRLPQDRELHNGGWIGFGPDGYLYVATGDDTMGRSAFDLRGKILRIDPSGDDYPDDPDRNYAIPPENPFADGFLGDPAVLAMGLRNPWRCGFDPLTGDLWIGDVGGSRFEEVNLIPAGTGGQHFGSGYWEGEMPFDESQEPNGFTFPVFSWAHADGANVIIGGAVYRGEAIPELYGAYIFADWSASIFALWREGDDVRIRNITPEIGAPPSRGLIYGFGTTADGEILICYQFGIWQIVPDNCLRRVGALLAHYGADDTSDPEFPFDLDDNEDGQINLADLAATLSTAPCGG